MISCIFIGAAVVGRHLKVPSYFVGLFYIIFLSTEPTVIRFFMVIFLMVNSKD